MISTEGSLSWSRPERLSEATSTGQGRCIFFELEAKTMCQWLLIYKFTYIEKKFHKGINMKQTNKKTLWKS